MFYISVKFANLTPHVGNFFRHPDKLVLCDIQDVEFFHELFLQRWKARAYQTLGKKPIQKLFLLV